MWFSVPSRQRQQALTGPRVVEQVQDNVGLPIPQTQRLTGAGSLRNPQEPLDERDNSSAAADLRQHRQVRRALETAGFGPALISDSYCVTETCAGVGVAQGPAGQDPRLAGAVLDDNDLFVDVRISAGV
jgi:hypothetical protein